MSIPPHIPGHHALLRSELNELHDTVYAVSKQVKLEVERRRKLGTEYVERCQAVKEKYQRLHPSVYQISVSIRKDHIHDVHAVV